MDLMDFIIQEIHNAIIHPAPLNVIKQNYANYNKIISGLNVLSILRLFNVKLPSCRTTHTGQEGIRLVVHDLTFNWIESLTNISNCLCQVTDTFSSGSHEILSVVNIEIHFIS